MKKSKLFGDIYNNFYKKSSKSYEKSDVQGLLLTFFENKVLPKLSKELDWMAGINLIDLKVGVNIMMSNNIEYN